MTELTSSHTVQPSATVGFLGPVGTFTEQALLSQRDLAAAQRREFDSFPDLLHAVERGDLDFGFVAIENAIEGTVNITADTLTFDVDLLIQREVVLPIEMTLMAKRGTSLAQIHTVSSFPHAYAQCRDWLRANLPDAKFAPATSTAGAAEVAASGDDPGVAAIANARAAEVYDLDIIAHDIADHGENATRFVLVARSGIPPATGNDKTSLVVFQRADAPGSLLGILQEFAARQVNLSLLLSRPTKKSLGDYCFVIDINGHLADPLVADALRSLKMKHDVKFLGSYPAATPLDDRDRDHAEAHLEEAKAWIRGLRAQLTD
ncbi:MAG: prephenate dehydratase [Actinobacteria bacterium]|nr:prephenate dehydratase [Actinomycetota bacterium]